MGGDESTESSRGRRNKTEKPKRPCSRAALDRQCALILPSSGVTLYSRTLMLGSRRTTVVRCNSIWYKETPHGSLRSVSRAIRSFCAAICSYAVASIGQLKRNDEIGSQTYDHHGSDKNILTIMVLTIRGQDAQEVRPFLGYAATSSNIKSRKTRSGKRSERNE